MTETCDIGIFQNRHAASGPGCGWCRGGRGGGGGGGKWYRIPGFHARTK